MIKSSDRMKPKLSIVYSARNDNYGGHLIERIQSTLNALIYLTNTFQYDTELIIVEYNPPEHTARLSSVLTITDNTHLTVRFIEVPRSFHTTLPLSNKTPFFEYIAKNIGIRRASADFILSTNLDIVFSNELFSYFSSHPLDKHAFYRINRSDIPYREFPRTMTGMDIVNRSKESAYVTLTEHGVSILRPFSVHGFRSFCMKYFYPFIMHMRYGKLKGLNPPLHERAAGDFLLMHKSMWNKIRGFSELPVSGYLDGYILYHAHAVGLSQIVLPYPIYHMYHEYDRKGRPTKMLSEYVSDRNKIFKTKTMIMQNKRIWGAPAYTFKEKIFSNAV